MTAKYLIEKPENEKEGHHGDYRSGIFLFHTQTVRQYFISNHFCLYKCGLL